VNLKKQGNALVLVTMAKRSRKSTTASSHWGVWALVVSYKYIQLLSLFFENNGKVADIISKVMIENTNLLQKKNTIR
jgi:hypothetical protein